MEKLTKEQRHDIYIKCLDHLILRQDYSDFICYAIDNVHGFPDSLETYPEVFKHKPEDSINYFFPCDEAGWNKRIEILKQAIEETK